MYVRPIFDSCGIWPRTAVKFVATKVPHFCSHPTKSCVIKLRKSVSAWSATPLKRWEVIDCRVRETVVHRCRTTISRSRTACSGAADLAVQDSSRQYTLDNSAEKTNYRAGLHCSPLCKCEAGCTNNESKMRSSFNFAFLFWWCIQLKRHVFFA